MSLGYDKYAFFTERGGGKFPVEHTRKAIEELENFCSILKSEGVNVRRPDIVDFQSDYKTPDFYSPVGLYNAMPRYDITHLNTSSFSVCSFHFET